VPAKLASVSLVVNSGGRLGRRRLRWQQRSVSNQVDHVEVDTSFPAKSSGFRWDVGCSGRRALDHPRRRRSNWHSSCFCECHSEPTGPGHAPFLDHCGWLTTPVDSLVTPILSCWGKDSFGESADSIGGQATFVSGAPRGVDLATASDHTCEVTLVRTVWCWGLNATGELGRPGAGVDERPLGLPGCPAWEESRLPALDSCIVSTGWSGLVLGLE